MRIFVAGATGAIGALLVPRLLQQGHEVVGSSRTEAGLRQLREQGATAVQLDMFDRERVLAAVAEAAPDAVVHQLTALSEGNPADNARIREEGTRNLVDAAKAAGVRRIVAQSISWAYEPGSGPATEDVPLDLSTGEPRSVSVNGVHALETAVAEIETHVVLRFGTFYGPRTWYSKDAMMGEKFRRGEFTANDGVSSFVHVDDAAAATVLALNWPSGTVNIVDDEPATAKEWAPAFAEAVGAAIPETGTGGAGWERGARNTLAKSTLAWAPAYPSWRTGFKSLA